MAWVRDVNSLYDFIGYVVLRAPDQFPREDYLRDDEQLTLDKAFDELRAGVRLVQADFPERQVSGELQLILDESLALYRSGERVAAAHRLQDFSSAIFSE